MKIVGENVLRCFFLLILGVIVGTLLLVLAFSVPVDEDKAQESYHVMMEESDYSALPVMGDMTGMNVQSFEPGVLDNVSDTIMLYTALDVSQEGQSALYRSMYMYCGSLGSGYCSGRRETTVSTGST